METCPPSEIEIFPTEILTTEFTFTLFPSSADYSIEAENTEDLSIDCIDHLPHSHWKQCTVKQATASTKYVIEANYLNLKSVTLQLTTAAFQEWSK